MDYGLKALKKLNFHGNLEWTLYIYTKDVKIDELIQKNQYNLKNYPPNIKQLFPYESIIYYNNTLSNLVEISNEPKKYPNSQKNETVTVANQKCVIIIKHTWITDAINYNLTSAEEITHIARIPDYVHAEI